MHPITPLLPPDRTPPIRTPEDMHRQWCALMGELGFARRMLWFTFIDGRGSPLGVLPVIEDVPVTPTSRMTRNIIGICMEILIKDIGPGGSVAFLLARPGPGHVTSSDRAWARSLQRAASRVELSLQPIFVATDTAVHPLDLPLAA